MASAAARNEPAADLRRPRSPEPLTAVPGLRAQALRLDARHRDATGFDDYVRAAWGFRVVGPGGRVGTVEGHLYDTAGRLAGLTVSSGLLRRRRLELPLSSVEWVLPYGRRLLLTQDPDTR